MYLTPYFGSIRKLNYRSYHFGIDRWQLMQWSICAHFRYYFSLMRSINDQVDAYEGKNAHLPNNSWFSRVIYGLLSGIYHDLITQNSIIQWKLLQKPTNYSPAQLFGNGKTTYQKSHSTNSIQSLSRFMKCFTFLSDVMICYSLKLVLR